MNTKRLFTIQSGFKFFCVHQNIHRIVPKHITYEYKVVIKCDAIHEAVAFEKSEY